MQSYWNVVAYNPWNSVAAGLIQQEFEEMQSNPSVDFKYLPLSGNLYDWRFAIRGPNGTDFEGGIYHGRIQFSIEYPHKAPVFMKWDSMFSFSEAGRFKTPAEISYCQICFRGVRNALLQLIDSLLAYPDGALALAIKSGEAAPRYGTALLNVRRKLIRGGDIQASYQNDLDKRMPGIHIWVGNTINANNSQHVGI